MAMYALRRDNTRPNGEKPQLIQDNSDEVAAQARADRALIQFNEAQNRIAAVETARANAAASAWSALASNKSQPTGPVFNNPYPSTPQVPGHPQAGPPGPEGPAGPQVAAAPANGPNLPANRLHPGDDGVRFL